jgi:RecA/RadA recombinase
MKSNSLIEKILKNSPTKNSSILSESVFFKKKDVIPTDLPILNVAFSGSLDGGLISGLTIFAGASKSFKTLLGLFCVKAFLDKYKDGACIFYDSEGGVTPEYLKTNGIDPSRVIHVPIEHIEMLKFDMVKALKELDRNDKVIIMVDSIGNTASLKELEDAENEKSVAEMQRAKSLKALFRMITPSLISKDIPCIAIAHTYQTMELYSKAIISGGCLVKDTKLRMSNGYLKSIQDIKVGDLVSTLIGPKPVTHCWTPDTLENGKPLCYRITFEDGYSVVCSGNHPFMTDKKWITAEDLYNFGEFLPEIERIQNDTIKISKIEKLNEIEVYDISVKDAEHYVLENGVVTHNTGLMYSANQAFIISKSQEKEGTELSGFKFTINVEKSRYVKEKSKLAFTVYFNGGIQKWSSLFELAQESGHIIKPKQGWYQTVDMETGEISAKSYRAKELEGNDAYFEALIKDPKFKSFIEHKFKLGVSVIGSKDIVDSDFDNEVDNDE